MDKNEILNSNSDVRMNVAWNPKLKEVLTDKK
jgi:hypothetical protein